MIRLVEVRESAFYGMASIPGDSDKVRIVSELMDAITGIGGEVVLWATEGSFAAPFDDDLMLKVFCRSGQLATVQEGCPARHYRAGQPEKDIAAAIMSDCWLAMPSRGTNLLETITSTVVRTYETVIPSVKFDVPTAVRTSQAMAIDSILREAFTQNVLRQAACRLGWVLFPDHDLDPVRLFATDSAWEISENLANLLNDIFVSSTWVREHGANLKWEVDDMVWRVCKPPT